MMQPTLSLAHMRKDYRNFAGLFPWIDFLFGTFYMPRGVQPERFGVAGEHVPATLLGQLAYPFVKSVRQP